MSSHGVSSVDFSLATSPAAATTLVELLRWRASHQAERRAYTFLTDGEAHEINLTYPQFDLRARAIAAALQRIGDPGQRALLLYPPGLDYLTAFFGCLYAGLIAVPAYPPRPNRQDSRLQAIAVDSAATVVLAPSSLSANKDGLGMRELSNLHWLATDLVPDELADLWSDPYITEDTLAFLQYTSGSTATPRGVRLTHANLLHNQRLIQQVFASTPDDYVVTWLPPYHDMGLIGGLLHPLSIGMPVMVMEPLAFLQRPLRWLNAIARTGATISGGPNFAYELCVAKTTPEERAQLDLSRWQVAFNGAEPVRPSTLDRFVEAFAPAGFQRSAFLPCYGLAEATLIVSGCQRDAEPTLYAVSAAALEEHTVAAPTSEEDAQLLVSAGPLTGEQELQIVDPETHTICAPDRVGEIWIAGGSIAQGYWEQSEASAATFGARIVGSTAGPFLRTGDLGFVHENQLYVTGRRKDLIIIDGRNHYPQDIELTAERAHEVVRPGGSAAFSVEHDGQERLILVVELRRAQYAQAAALDIRRAVMQQHDLRLHELVWVRPGQIPKTSSGKVRRQACRALYLSGALKTREGEEA